MPHQFATLMNRVAGQGPDAEAAARELVDRHGAAILQVVREKLFTKLRSKFDSQDFAQSVWASFFAIPPDQRRFERHDQLMLFLMRMARNKVLEASRRLRGKRNDINRECSLGGSQAPAANDLPGREPTGSAVAVAHEAWERLFAKKPVHRQAARPTTYCGRTPEEIARELGVSVRTVYRVLRHMKPGGDA